MSTIIHRKPPYRVYVEEGRGGAMAHVAELPGCFAVGSRAAQAVGALPERITSFLVWLREHHERLVPEAYVSRPSAADLYVAGVRRGGAPLVAGSKAELFEFDLVPWDDDRVERAIRWLTYSRGDLMAAIAELDEEEMRMREVLPGRTLWATLWHVANAEYGYVNRIAGPLENAEPVSDAQPEDVRERLSLTREIFERRVRGIPGERRGDTVFAPWAARPDEPWTVQKALRRALEHELEHLAEIKP